MKAILLDRPRTPLRLADFPPPSPGPDDLLVRVLACGACRTDLHILDGELAPPALPLIMGHQIVGEVVDVGEATHGFTAGQRVGIPWLGWTCGVCHDCTTGRENLCARARFTGFHRDGGFAELATADHRFCFPLSKELAPHQAAPLLCAGLIGYRALRMTGDAARIGFYGFGAAAHILAQVARWQGRRVFAFTRPGDTAGQDFARSLGADWAGGSDQAPPVPLDAAIIFAPAGLLVPAALRAVAPGGTVVAAGIHMSDIPAFPYDILRGERVLRSVANLTRADAVEFLAIAPRVPVRTSVEVFPLARTADALEAIRHGRVHGAAVVVP